MALNKDTELCPQRSPAAGGARLGLNNPELHLPVIMLDSGQHLGRPCWEGDDSWPSPASPRETVLSVLDLKASLLFHSSGDAPGKDWGACPCLSPLLTQPVCSSHLGPEPEHAVGSLSTPSTPASPLPTP